MKKLNVSTMKEATEFLMELMTFKAFTRLKSNSKSTIRTIKYINITRKSRYDRYRN